MTTRLFSPSLHATALAATFALCTAAFAADAPKLPAIPAEPLVKKKELLFADDFERAELGKAQGFETGLGCNWLTSQFPISRS